jgi:hypothetical protein
VADVTHLTWDLGGKWTADEWDPDSSFQQCGREATEEEYPAPPSSKCKQPGGEEGVSQVRIDLSPLSTA